MRNYQVRGQSLSISERELDVFTGVSRGGTLVVVLHEGGEDIQVVSWSGQGFDRSPNAPDLISLLRKGAFVIAEVAGRDQIALTPLGRDVAQLIGVYSLAALVQAPVLVVAEEVDAGHEVFTLEEDPVAVPTTPDPETDAPETNYPEGHPDRESELADEGDDEDDVDLGSAEDTPDDDNGNSEDDDDFDEDDEDDEDEKPELPSPGAGFIELTEFADKYGVEHEGLRSKAKVRAAIEAHFSA